MTTTAPSPQTSALLSSMLQGVEAWPLNMLMTAAAECGDADTLTAILETGNPYAALAMMSNHNAPAHIREAATRQAATLAE